MQQNDLPDLETIRARLRLYKLSLVAKEAGLNKHALYRMINEQSRPPYEVVKAVIEWMQDHE